MTKEQFERETNFFCALAIAKCMLMECIIDNEDYNEVESMLIEEYNPLIAKLQ